jgi:polyisoprenoid-binding protein YceI
MRPALTALSLAGLSLAAIAIAQMPTEVPGKPDVKGVVAGTYKIEPMHTEIGFSVLHLGYNPYMGLFSKVSGALTIDPAKPTAAQLNVTIPVSSIYTTVDELTQGLKGADWFDVAKYPTATFTSTAVEVRGTEARIAGNLTLHGVTKPVTIEARFVGAGTHPMTKAPAIGFEGRTTIKRSDFGVSNGIPFVSDEVNLTITAAFDRTGA